MAIDEHPLLVRHEGCEARPVESWHGGHRLRRVWSLPIIADGAPGGGWVASLGMGPARRPRLVDLASVAADRADRLVAVEVDLEEAGAAIGAAEEPAGAGDAPTQAAHVGSTSNGERVLGSREHELNGSFWPHRRA
jgi:hypothetical protein